MRPKRNNEKHFACTRMMPPLKHSKDDGAFDITKSDVVDWLCQQPELMQFLFDSVRYAVDDRHNHFIVYDKELGMWRGADFEGQGD